MHSAQIRGFREPATFLGGVKAYLLCMLNSYSCTTVRMGHMTKDKNKDYGDEKKLFITLSSPESFKRIICIGYSLIISCPSHLICCGGVVEGTEPSQ